MVLWKPRGGRRIYKIKHSRFTKYYPRVSHWVAGSQWTQTCWDLMSGWSQDRVQFQALHMHEHLWHLPLEPQALRSGRVGGCLHEKRAADSLRCCQGLLRMLWRGQNSVILILLSFVGTHQALGTGYTFCWSPVISAWLGVAEQGVRARPPWQWSFDLPHHTPCLFFACKLFHHFRDGPHSLRQWGA